MSAIYYQKMTLNETNRRLCTAGHSRAVTTSLAYFHRTCGRYDIEQYEQNDFSKVLDWNCVDAGDVRRHWQEVVA
jgi:hypothetical protein